MESKLLPLCLLATAISASAGIQTDGVSYNEITTDNGTTLTVENLWYNPSVATMDKTYPLSDDYTGYPSYDCFNYTFVTDKSLFITNISNTDRNPSFAKVDITTGECDKELYVCEYEEGVEAETEKYRWYSGAMDTAGNPFVITKATNNTTTSTTNAYINPLRISVLSPNESSNGNPIVRNFYNLDKDDSWNIYKIEVSGDLAAGNFIVWANAAVGASAGSASKTKTVRWAFENGEQVSRTVFDQAFSCMSIHEYDNGNILIDDADNKAGFGYPTLCKIEDDKIVAIGDPIPAENFTDVNGAAVATFSLNGEDYIVYQTASAQLNSQFSIGKLENFPEELNVSQNLWTLPGDNKSLSSKRNYGPFSESTSEKATVRVVTNEDSNSATLYFMANRSGIAAYRITAEAQSNINTGVKLTTIDNDTTVDVYSLAGVRVAVNTTIASAKQSLANGVYIAKSQNAIPCKFIVK
jgi:hypothetical protein